MADRATDKLLVADIGGSFIKMSVAGADGRTMAPIRRVPTPGRDRKAFVDTVAALAGTIAGEVAADAPLAIAVAGVVHPATGVMRVANIPDLDGVAPAPLIAAALGRPVHLVNDADAFALAEAFVGLGRGRRVVLGAIIGTGVGGGLVVDGRLVTGEDGMAGEWGHGPVASGWSERLGRRLPRLACGCGQSGCADTFGGARGIERLHVLIGHPEADSHAILKAWRNGDPAAAETIAVWADMLSEPLALTVNITGASIVPVGGGLGPEADLMALLDREVRRRILRRTDEALVVPAALGGEAGLQGAAILGAQKAGWFGDAGA